MDLNDMMQQAQMMQLELERAQEEIRGMAYTATAGGGMVEATALGDGSVQSIVIDPEVVDPEDVEMLQDLVVAAVNEALRGVAAQGEERLGSVTGGISIPGLF